MDSHEIVCAISEHHPGGTSFTVFKYALSAGCEVLLAMLEGPPKVYVQVETWEGFLRWLMHF